MNKSESKYFHTAAKMDDALLMLLEKKDFEYITVKEICEKAGVNRSTFYLHYETMADLLTESTVYMNQQFLSYMDHDSAGVVSKINSGKLDDLYFVTPEYLVPYLNYIAEHRRLFQTVVKRADTLQLDNSYKRMFHHVFSPILERFQIPEQDRNYMMSFYLNGLMAIVTSWLEDNCSGTVDYVVNVMQRCVMYND